MKPRIILDTSVVRNHLHQDPVRIDLDLLRAAKETVLVSLSDVTNAELLRGLFSGAITWEAWARIAELDALLDKELPVLPGGRELAVTAGLYHDADFSEVNSKIYYRESWRLLADARSRSDLERPRRYKDLTGTHEIRGDQAHVERMFEKERESWSDFIRTMQQNPAVMGKKRTVIAGIVDAGTEPEDDEAVDLQDMLEAQRRMLTHYLASAAKTHEPYNPESDKNKNDSLDLTMLFALILDNTIICTADTRSMRDRLKSTGATQAKRVISPAELNQHLASGTLSDLLKP